MKYYTVTIQKPHEKQWKCSCSMDSTKPLEPQLKRIFGDVEVLDVKAGSDCDKRTYFSVDYRSPPSGWGQIVNDHKQIVTNPNSPYLHTLIVLQDQGDLNDTQYREVVAFESKLLERDGWDPKINKKVFQLLRERNVEYVYDSEMGYEYSADYDQEKHYFKLETWIKHRS
mgnify:CR=1 FL=1